MDLHRWFVGKSLAVQKAGSHMLSSGRNLVRETVCGLGTRGLKDEKLKLVEERPSIVSGLR